jgi:hypothetical protein
MLIYLIYHKTLRLSTLYWRCFHGTWWINRPALYRPTSGRLFVMRQSRETLPSRNQAPSECFCEHLHQSPREMTLHPPLTSIPLKQEPTARGKRAPRAPSIVGWFSRQPSPASVVGTVAPIVCPLVLAAAQVPLATMHEDGQNDSTLATTPDGPAGVETAVP